MAVSANLSLYTPSRLTDCTEQIACITSAGGRSWRARKARGRSPLACLAPRAAAFKPAFYAAYWMKELGFETMKWFSRMINPDV